MRTQQRQMQDPRFVLVFTDVVDRLVDVPGRVVVLGFDGPGLWVRRIV